MDPLKAQLLALAHDLGDRRQMAILGEGNVSGKVDGDQFLVKASGTCLGTLKARELVAVRGRHILEALDGATRLTDRAVSSLLMESRQDAGALKPSVETLFHAWLLTLPGVRFVGHVHAIAINQVLASPWARIFARRRILPDQVVYCGATSPLVPYVDPGLVLARRIRRVVARFVARHRAVPKTILLKNHGIIACGATHTEVMAALAMAEKAAAIFVGASHLVPPALMSAHQVRRIARRTDEHYRQAMLR